MSKQFDEWLKLADKDLRGRPRTDLFTETNSGITIKPLYCSSDTEQLTFRDSSPGAPPYTRGPYPSMYTLKPWTIRQYAGFSSASESNAFYKQCLANGQNALSIAFDLPTHRGYDSDHPRVMGDVGKAGVAIDSVEDMKILFDEISLAEVSVSMTMNGAVLPVLAAYIVAAEEQGVPPEKLSGTIQNDILKEYMVRNTFIYPPQPSMRIVGDIIAYTSQSMPKFNSVSISGYHMQEAGADPALELALTLGDGLEYIKTALNRGLDIDDFAPRLSFFFGIGMNFFLEICKLRAARTLWYELTQAFKPNNPKSSILRTHCQTSGYTLTAQDPYNNIIRTTIEAMAAVLGGTQSLHTNSFDEAVALPSDFAARLARNTQLILMEETDITSSVDPLGGSFMIETLTNDLISKAKSILETIENMGGMTLAIEKGYPKMLIEKSAAMKQARIDSGKDVIVGVNKFQNHDQDEKFDTREIDHNKVLRGQLESLRAVKSTRNEEKVQESLGRLRHGASAAENLVELSIEAIRLRATIGEVSDALRTVFGEHHQTATIVSNIYKENYDMDYKNSQYQNAAKLVSDFAQAEGRQPRILIVKLGQDGHDRGARIIATGFSDLGFDVDIGPMFQTPAEAAKQAVENDVHLVGVSSQAGAHETLIPQLRAELDLAGAQDIKIVLGGTIPPKDIEKMKQCGVDAVIVPGTSVPDAAIAVLATIYKAEDRHA